MLTSHSENAQDLRFFISAAARRQSRRSEPDTPESPETEAEPTFQFRIKEMEWEASSPAGTDQDIDNDDHQATALGVTADEVVGASQDEADEADESEYEQHVYREDSLSRIAADAIAAGRHPSKPAKKQTRKEVKVSRFGKEYPSLPPSVIKRLATTFARTNGSSGRLDRETLAAISQASDWFFEQAAEDLASYAEHAGRKTIEESDVVTLMKRYVSTSPCLKAPMLVTDIVFRQRQLNANTTPFSLAQKYLPRELLQEIRMAPPAKARKSRRRRMETIDEDAEE